MVNRDSLTTVEPEGTSGVGHVEAELHARSGACRDVLEARVKAVIAEVRARSPERRLGDSVVLEHELESDGVAIAGVDVRRIVDEGVVVTADLHSDEGSGGITDGKESSGEGRETHYEQATGLMGL